MKKSEKYQLNLPEGSDPYDVEHMNANTRIIEQKLKGNEEHNANKNNPHGVTKTQVGLGNVDNTADKDKPVSTAQATAIADAKAAGTTAQTNLTAHISNKNNPHGVTKTQVGLGNVDNTADKDKPVSTAQKQAIDNATVSGTATGTNPTIQNSTNAPFIYGKFKGYTEQQTYSGKNKLNRDAITTGTLNGITYTLNEDGSVIVNGTATANTFINYGYVDISANTEYILSGCPSGGDGSTYKLATYKTNYGYSNLHNDFGSGRTFTLTEDMRCFVVIVVYKDTTVNNLKFEPMIRLATETDATYEPYVGGTASPNPDYPQEINGLAKDGAIEVKTCGKNLLKSTVGIATRDGVTFTTSDDGSVALNGTTNGNGYTRCYTDLNSFFNEDGKFGWMRAGKTYRFSIDSKNSNIAIYGLYNTFTNTDEYVPIFEPARVTVDATIPKNAYHIILRIVSLTGGGYTHNNDVVYPMIRPVEIADDTYEPYTETTTAITTDAPLYEGDYLEVYADGSGKLYKKFMNFNPTTVEIVAENVGAYIKLIKGYCKARSTALCNYLKLDVTGKTTSFTFGSNAEGNFSHCFIKVLGLTTKEEYQSWLNERSDLEVVYELATPTETPLTAAQVAQFKQLYTFEPVTNVLCDGEVEMRYYKANVNGETVGMLQGMVEKSNETVGILQESIRELQEVDEGGTVLSFENDSGEVSGSLSVFHHRLSENTYLLTINATLTKVPENSDDMLDVNLTLQDIGFADNIISDGYSQCILASEYPLIVNGTSYCLGGGTATVSINNKGFYLTFLPFKNIKGSINSATNKALLSGTMFVKTFML